MRIKPAKHIRGRLKIPGDKSISHRAALIASLSHGRTLLGNFSTSRDCESTLDCLRELGVKIDRLGAQVEIVGVGLAGFRQPRQSLDCGNSGSTMRMLAGMLASQNFMSVLTGDESLRSRPMQRIIEPLELMGAEIESDHGHAPLTICGHKPLQPIDYRLPIASAQVKTCILLAGLNAIGQTRVSESANSTRDHTERMLQWFGVSVMKTESQNDGLVTVSVNGPTTLNARDGVIPGDISSAAFFLVAASLLPNSDLTIEGVGLNPTRAAILDVLKSLNVEFQVSNNTGDFNEPCGSIHVTNNVGFASATENDSITLQGVEVSRLIDELPIIAVLGSQLSGGITIRDASELRLKEVDRIDATVSNLRAMGVEVDEFEDGFAIKRKASLKGARIESHGDHRIAMAFSIAALIAKGDSDIVGANCVDISFPEFFEMLESVVER